MKNNANHRNLSWWICYYFIISNYFWKVESSIGALNSLKNWVDQDEGQGMLKCWPNPSLLLIKLIKLITDNILVQWNAINGLLIILKKSSMSRTDIYNLKDSKREGFDRFCMKNIFSNHHHSFQLNILKEHQ